MFSNLGTKFMGALFEGGDQPKPQAEQAPAPQGAPQAVPTAAGAASKPIVSYHPTPSVNEDMVSAIRKQTFNRSTALTALITASDALAEIIPDPVMRLKAAQKTAGHGRGPKEFSDAVQIHLSDVDAAEMQFAQAIDAKVKQEVGGLRAQAASTESQIASANTEIQNIQQRIAHLQQTIIEQTTNLGNLNSQAAAKETELRQAEVEFKAAAAHVRNELNGHKATILSTLG